MLQYMFALNLKDHVTNLEIIGHQMPIWGLKSPFGSKNLWYVPSIREPDPRVEFVSNLYRTGILRSAKIRRVPIDISCLGDASRYRSVFSAHSAGSFEPSHNDLVISVRGGEILRSTHQDYGPMPIAFYKAIIGKSSLTPVFIGQLGDDYYSELLRTSFPSAKFIPSQGALGDFQSLLAAKHLVLSISTFSWLAGWLSHAETIHFPVYGMFNPAQRFDAWFLPDTESRYRFYRMPLRKWFATSEQVAELASDFEVTPLSYPEIASLKMLREHARSKVRRSAERDLYLRSIFSYPLNVF